jgi:hypothetical protein
VGLESYRHAAVSVSGRAIGAVALQPVPLDGPLSQSDLPFELNRTDNEIAGIERLRVVL